MIMLPQRITLTIVDPFAVLILFGNESTIFALISGEIRCFLDSRANGASGLLSRFKSLVHNSIFTFSFSHCIFVPSERMIKAMTILNYFDDCTRVIVFTLAPEHCKRFHENWFVHAYNDIGD